MDDVSIEYVKDLGLTQQKTHSEVSLLLKEAYPDRRGLGLRSVRRGVARIFQRGSHMVPKRGF